MHTSVFNFLLMYAFKFFSFNSVSLNAFFYNFVLMIRMKFMLVVYFLNIARTCMFFFIVRKQSKHYKRNAYVLLTTCLPFTKSLVWPDSESNHSLQLQRRAISVCSIWKSDLATAADCGQVEFVWFKLSAFAVFTLFRIPVMKFKSDKLFCHQSICCNDIRLLENEVLVTQSLRRIICYPPTAGLRNRKHFIEFSNLSEVS